LASATNAYPLDYMFSWNKKILRFNTSTTRFIGSQSLSVTFVSKGLKKNHKTTSPTYETHMMQ